MTEANPDAVLDPETSQLVDRVTGEPTTPDRSVHVVQESTAWNFVEFTPSGEWSPEVQGQLDARGGDLSGLVGPMTDTVTVGEAYFAATSPLAEATRRFRVYCGLPAAYETGPDTYGPDGPLIGYRDVGLTDPFWNPLVRLGILWGMIEVPPFAVVAPAEVATYGGLVVNMPTWLSVEAGAWRPYFSGVDEYMGWVSQLGRGSATTCC